MSTQRPEYRHVRKGMLTTTCLTCLLLLTTLAIYVILLPSLWARSRRSKASLSCKRSCSRLTAKCSIGAANTLLISRNRRLAPLAPPPQSSTRMISTTPNQTMVVPTQRCGEVPGSRSQQSQKLASELRSPRTNQEITMPLDYEAHNTTRREEQKANFVDTHYDLAAQARAAARLFYDIDPNFTSAACEAWANAGDLTKP